MGTSQPDDKAEARGRQRRFRWLRWLVLAVVIVVVLAVATPLTVVGIASGSRMYTVADVPAHDVAIVYGAGLQDGGPGPYLVARLIIARDLYKSGKVKVILVSGDNLTVYHNEPLAMMQWLVAQGVPADKIVEDFAGADTYSTCVRARQIFGVTSAILVSQTYHLPRAVTTCRLVGVDAVGVGDSSVRAGNRSMWISYQVREVFADANMLLSVVTARKPILGPYDPSVDHALGR
ncbi:MAG: YdcF family protein [Propionibacteriaceae bacterium]|nr:YdcF family protein [Propionibacteriaceae bacterium]